MSLIAAKLGIQANSHDHSCRVCRRNISQARTQLQLQRSKDYSLNMACIVAGPYTITEYDRILSLNFAAEPRSSIGRYACLRLFSCVGYQAD